MWELMSSDVNVFRRKKKITVTLTITSFLASSQGFQSFSNWRVLVGQAGNSGLQFSGCQTISQTCCMMAGYRISIRHWPLCYFLLASIKRFPFKMGFCRFPRVRVFLEVLERKQVWSALSFGIRIFPGRWLPTMPLNIQPQREPCYLLNISGDVYAEHEHSRRRPIPLLHRQSLWNGKCMGLLSASTWPLLLTFSKLTYKAIPWK